MFLVGDQTARLDIFLSLMLNTTIDAIRAVLRMDPTVDPSERIKIIYRLRRGDLPKKPGSGAPARLLRRKIVVERLCCSLRAVDRLAVQGVLRRVAYLWPQEGGWDPRGGC